MSNFDIATTPHLEAVSTEDQQRRGQDLQKRVNEALRTAESQAEVIAALEIQNDAAERLGRLRRAERSLSQFAKESREHAALSAREALDALIESASSGEKPDFKKMQGLTAIENQNHFATRAIQKIVEHSIPRAQITNLRQESHALMTRAKAVEKIAQERAEKVLGHLRDAVTEEMVLPIDLSKGVAGALLAHAAGLKRIAVQVSENADALEKSYRERRIQ
jgi:hypothetical protein